MAGIAFALHIAALQASKQAWILVSEATVLGGMFAIESGDSYMTAASLQQKFVPQLVAIIAAYGIASLLYSAWDKLMVIKAFASVALGVGIGKSFFVDGTLLAWSLGRVSMMETILQG